MIQTQGWDTGEQLEVALDAMEEAGYIYIYIIYYTYIYI